MMRGTGLILVLYALLAIPSAWRLAWAEDPPVSGRALRFRRVLVPREALADLTRGYLPMKRDEFDARLAGILANEQPPAAGAAWIEAADYQARFDNGQWTGGSARLQVAHAAQHATLLSLAPCGLAMGTAAWEDDAGPRAATVGTDPSGHVQVLVSQPGVLQFPWTLQGEPHELGEYRFTLTLAAAPLNVLCLDVPDGFALLADRGLVLEEGEAEAAARENWNDAAGMRRFVVQLGGISQVNLTVVPSTADHRRQQFVGVEQETRYRLEPDGLEVECDIDLDIHHQPLDELRVEVDSELQMTGVRLGQVDLDWRSVRGPEGRYQIVHIPFAERLAGTHSTLQLFAVGSLGTGPTWRLPTFRPQNVLWRQGTMSLTVPESVELRHVSVHNGRQSGTATLAGDTAAVRLQFELFETDGAVEVSVARRMTAALVEVGTTVDLDAGAVTALTIADLRCEVGELFVVNAVVPNAWTVDGIESEPANAVQDYQFVAYEAEFKRLQIQLSQPLAADQTLRLKIRTHRSPSFLLGPEDFRPVEFLAVKHALRLVAVAPDANHRLDLTGDAALERVDPAGLPPSSAARLQTRAGSVVFEDNERANYLTIHMTREDAEFAAAVSVDVDVDDQFIVESYRVVCTPDTAPVGRLQIHLTEPRSADVPWRWVGDGNGILSARRLHDDDDSQAGVQRSGETWEIVLRTPQRAPFEVRGQRTTACDEACELSLATLPDAVAHDGRLTIRATHGQRLSIEASAVSPIPCDPVSPDNYPTSRACYRFDASKSARVVVKRMPASGGPGPLWAWQCRLTSQYSPVGEALHVAAFLLENGGAGEFQVTLPEHCTLRGLDIDGVQAPQSLRATGNGLYQITLPPGARFPRVEITYHESGPPLGWWRRLATELPRVDIPVLDARWNVWLPPDYLPISTRPVGRGLLPPSPSWAQRLLGPLGAGPATQPWRLFGWSTWTGLGGPPELRRAAAVQAGSFLEQFGTALLNTRSQTTGDPPTWREVVSAYRDIVGESADSRVLWVDAGRLAPEGFLPEASAPAWEGDTPAAAAASLLMRAGLVVVVHRHELLLTSRTKLAQFPADWEALSEASVVMAGSQTRLAAELDDSITGRRSGLVPVGSWLALPALAHLPWRSHGEASRLGATSWSWGWREMGVPASGLCTLTVGHTPSWSAVGWTCLLGMAGLVGVLGRHHPQRLAWLLVPLGAVAMAVPAAWVPLTSNLFLGMLLGLVLALGVRVAHPRTVHRPDESTGGLPTASLVSSMLLAVGLCLFSASGGLAADPQAAEAHDAADPVYPLMVPVDADLQPVGQYDYLPVEFWDALHRRTASGSASPGKWLVLRAAYQAAFNWRQQRSSLDVTAVTAVYELELLAGQETLEFPWDGQSADVELLEARWRGEPIELAWNTARTALLLAAPDAGTYTLELVLRPEVREEPGERRVRFAIPAIAQSQLAIAVPAGAPEVRVPSAAGATRIDPVQALRQVELGPVRQLELSWRSGTADETPPRPLDVQQLSWLRVRPKDYPESVVLATRLRLQAVGRPIAELTLRVDPRLRYLPPADATTFELTAATPDDRSGELLTLRWREPLASEGVVTLQFELANTSGVGNVPLPRLESIGTRTTRRWLAISVSPDLEFTPGTSDVFTPLDSTEFLAAWGEADSAPHLCYRITAEDPTWSLATRSRHAKTLSRERVDLSVGRDRLEMVLEAELETTNGEVFQHRVTVPPELQVTSAVVLSGQTDLVQAASHDGSGTISILLRSGVSGVQHLILRGVVPLPDTASPIPLPALALRDVTVRSQALYVYRQPEVLVQIQPPTELTPLPGATEGRYREFYGRQVGAFAAFGGALTGLDATTLEIHPNQPRVDVRLVVTLHRAHDAWEAIADVDARVAGDPRGIVDTLRFEIPPEWVGPLTLNPLVPYEIHALPNQRRFLVVRPPQAVLDRLQIQIRGSLALGPGERGRTPNIVPLDVTESERFFVLPTRWDQQRIEWETPGLVEVPLVEVLPAERADNDSWVAYRVWSRPRAVISQVQRVTGQRQIVLADVYIRCADDGGCFGVASFAVEPAGTNSCTLEIPADVELVQAAVDGVPAVLLPLGDRRFHVRLASEHLPQSLTLVFRGGSVGGRLHDRVHFAVPWITDVDVEQTLWTLQVPGEAERQQDDVERHRVLSTQQEAQRLLTTARLVESAADTVLESPPRDVQAWYTPWALRLANTGAHLAHARASAAGDDPRFGAATPAAIFAQQEAIAQRLKVSPTVMDFLRQTSRHPQPRDLWTLRAQEPAATAHFAFDGPMPELAFSVHDPVAGFAGSGLPAALGVLAIGASLALLARRGLFAHLWRHWPHVFGVAAGFIWWLVAIPSALGWIVVVASLWRAMRLPYATKLVPAHTESDREDWSAS